MLCVVLEFGKLGEAFNAVASEPGLRNEFRMSLELSWNAGGNKVSYSYENDERAVSVTQFAQGTGSQTFRSTLSVGVLDSLSDFVQTKEAEVAKLEQVIELEDKEKEVVQSVKQSYFDYQKARIQVKSAKKHAPAYGKGLRSPSPPCGEGYRKGPDPLIVKKLKSAV